MRNTTYERMLQLRKRVYAAIGKEPIVQLDLRTLQFFINSLSRDGANERTNQPLSPKTVRHYHSFLSDVFDYSVRMGFVKENPCTKVIVPRLKQDEKQIYTIDEVQKLLFLLNNAPLKYHVFFAILIFSGFRRGEMLGFEWKDVDFKNCLIGVHRTSNYTSIKGTYTDETKTQKSKRTLKFPKEIIELLKKYKIEQDNQAAKYAEKWANTDRLFVKKNGEPMNNGTPYEWLKGFCKNNDLPFYGIHGFRHLFASLLVNQGVDIVTVSGALGHSTVSTTSNIYCHMLADAQVKVSDAITNALHLSL